MNWHLSHCCDPAARRLMDRHYPRQSVGAARFVAPGVPLVLTVGDPVVAVWVSA